MSYRNSYSLLQHKPCDYVIVSLPCFRFTAAACRWSLDAICVTSLSDLVKARGFFRSELVWQLAPPHTSLLQPSSVPLEWGGKGFGPAALHNELGCPIIIYFHATCKGILMKLTCWQIALARKSPLRVFHSPSVLKLKLSDLQHLRISRRKSVTGIDRRLRIPTL